MDNSCNFEFNPFPDEEPMEFNKDMRDMMTSSNSWYDDASCWRRLKEVLENYNKGSCSNQIQMRKVHWQEVLQNLRQGMI